VNGVVNIITRDSRDAQGGFASLGAGDDERGAAVRYGGRLGERGNFRIYGKQFGRDQTSTDSGGGRRDGFAYRQGGFRLDWNETADQVTLQGDSYDGRIGQPVGGDKIISGANLLTRWNRTLAEGSTLQLQAYFDHTRRTYPESFAESLDTSDIELQHRFKWGSAHDIVWGGGYRWMSDDVSNSAALAFVPAQRELRLGNLFIQDTVALTERLQLSLGLKIEHNSYTGRELLPNIRLGWQVDDRSLLWSAISRAVRTPSRLDRDFYLPGNAPFVLAGGPTFVSEILTAYEIGYRSQPSSRTSFSVSTFYNLHDKLRSVEGDAGGRPPLTLGNSMEGETYGVEAWGSHQAADWWRLSAGYSHLHKSLRFKPGSNDVAGLQAAGNDPQQQFWLRSHMNLPNRWELDLSLRAVGKLPNPVVPSYHTVDLRLGWNPAPGIELSVGVGNLLNRRHAEFGAQGVRSEFGRSVFLQLNWRQ
jgi:iron complex outermembrane receptor protein